MEDFDFRSIKKKVVMEHGKSKGEKNQLITSFSTMLKQGPCEVCYFFFSIVKNRYV